MRVANIQSSISFKSGYPMFGSGHLSFTGHFDPATGHCVPTHNGHFEPRVLPFSYPGYPGYIPSNEPRTGGTLNLIG